MGKGNCEKGDSKEEGRDEIFNKAEEISNLIREKDPENYNVTLQEFIVQLLIESTDLSCFYELVGMLEEAKMDFREFMHEAMEEPLCDECKKKRKDAEKNN